MSKKSAPKTDLEQCLFDEFEKQAQIRVASRRIARAIDQLSPAQGEEALEIVLHAVRKSCGELANKPLAP